MTQHFEIVLSDELVPFALAYTFSSFGIKHQNKES
jgi:hypothetical protein